MMKVSLYPADQDACGNYRMTWPGEHLAATGHDVVVNPYKQRHRVPIDVVNEVDEVTGTVRILDVKPVEADVVVMQRTATERLVQVIELIQQQGVKVVIDVDDALWAIHRRNLSWGAYNGLRGRAHWKWLLRACQCADLVTVTTPELAEKVGGVVVPNFVPERALEVGRTSLERWDEQGRDARTVGWAATQLTHPRDPRVTNGDVAQVVRSRDGVKFVSVGGRIDREPMSFGFGVEDITEGNAIATGEIPRDLWTDAVAGLDVSLVPLEDTQFNRGKSWLKMLESAAAGCAVIASPTPDNVRAWERGVGVLAKDRKWGKQLEVMLEGEAAFEQAEENWRAAGELTIEENSWRWLEAWEGLA